MIEVRHLTKRYGSTLAVDDLNFTIEKGQIYGFLGPNGAGKSTTMNIITGYIASTDGTVTIDGIPFSPNMVSPSTRVSYWTVTAVTISPEIRFTWYRKSSPAMPPVPWQEAAPMC